MFKRRKKQNLSERITNIVWPQIGWKRYGQYVLMRLSRLKGSPSEIARGVACGVAISFTPFVGFHFVLAAITAWFVKGNILASAIGTAAGNPWTFPFIWVSVLYTGRKILGLDHLQAVNVDFENVFARVFHALIEFDFGVIWNDVWPILWPMMVGCIPFYIVFWLLSFFIFDKALKKISERKKKVAA